MVSGSERLDHYSPQQIPPSSSDAEENLTTSGPGLKRLRQSRQRKILARLQSALVWGLAAEEAHRRVAGFDKAHRSLEVRPQGTLADDALWAIALAQRLPEFRKSLAVDEWARIVTGLVEMAEDAQHSVVLADPWVATLVCCELGLTLAISCPEHPECVRAGERSREAVAEIMQSCCSKDGTPLRLETAHIFPFFASWVRLLGIYVELFGKLPSELREPYEYLVRFVLRQTRSDHSIVFQEGRNPLNPQEWKSLWRQARRLISDPTDRDLVKGVCRGRKTRRQHVVRLASHCDEVAGIARLSQGWKKSDASLWVDFQQPQVRIELGLRGRPVMLGTCQPKIEWNGHLLEYEGAWSLQCWYSEPEADYLELEWPLSHGCRLQRQFLLAKEDSCVFFADAFLPPNRGLTRYNIRWTLANGIEFQSHDETREGKLNAGSTSLARVIPLSFPEWRRERSAGNLVQEGNGLSMDVEVEGSALYVPLLLNFDRKALGREVTWRQLTVAESLRRVEKDVAVGYRFQCGRKQWLIYKSLTRFGNRTVLGQNYSLDFAFNRFLRSGMTKTIVDVEIDTEEDGAESLPFSGKPCESAEPDPNGSSAGWT